MQKEVDYLLEVGANGSHGYIDAFMVEDSRRRLAERGFETSDLVYKVETTSGVNGTDPAAPVLRGSGIKLTITYPYQQLFEIDRLIGITPPSEEKRMGATGMKMSEYVP